MTLNQQQQTRKEDLPVLIYNSQTSTASLELELSRLNNLPQLSSDQQTRQAVLPDLIVTSHLTTTSLKSELSILSPLNQNPVFDPASIKPKEVTKIFMKTVTQLQKFDKLWDSMKESLNDGMLWSLKNPLWREMSDSMDRTTWTVLRNTMKNAAWPLMLACMSDEQKTRLMFKTTEQSLMVSMETTMWFSMLAPIIVRLSKKEYEDIFTESSYLKTLPYDKIHSLSKLSMWFTEQGWLPQKFIRPNEYALISWSNPKDISLLSIDQSHVDKYGTPSYKSGQSTSKESELAYKNEGMIQ